MSQKFLRRTQASFRLLFHEPMTRVRHDGASHIVRRDYSFPLMRALRKTAVCDGMA